MYAYLKNEFKNPAFVFFVFLVLCLASVPVIQIALVVGDSWQGVPPLYVDDDLYYLARMHEIADNHPFIGNPYSLEHRDQLSPALFIADWLAALPMILSNSLVFAIFFNLLFWPLLLSLFLYRLFVSLRIPKTYSLIGAFLSYIQIYWLMTRPVVMQTVFPFFALFLLFFLQWLKDPLNKRRILLLVLSAVFNFYVYPYSWQIVLIVLFLACVTFVVLKKKQEIKSALKVIFSTLILSLPVFLYAFVQTQHPYYRETAARIGFVNTRLPSYVAFNYGRWIILSLLVYFLFLIWLDKKEKKHVFLNPDFLFFFLTGQALLIAMLSNVVVGIDIDTASHVARFVILWFSVIVFYCFYNLWLRFGQLSGLSWKRAMIIFSIMILCLVGFFKNIPRAIPFFSRDFNQIIESQDYKKPLSWLEDNVSEPAVIWANNDISRYVPVLTKHYVLFTAHTRLLLASNEEVEERYLVSNYFNDLSLEDLKSGLGLYGGFGASDAKPRDHNQKVKICRFFHLKDCGNAATAVDLKGEGYFNDLFDRYLNDIKPNILSKIGDFHVGYLIHDEKYDLDFSPGSIGADVVYKDARFSVYRLQ